MKSARRYAFDVLLDVSRGAYANLRLKQATAVYPSEAAFMSALVYTTLDHLLYIDFIIDSFCAKKPKPTVRCVLELGVCQILFMSIPERAACDESVKLVKEIGKGALAGYVNALLRSVTLARSNLPEPRGSDAFKLSIKHSYPLWLVERLCEQLGIQQAEALMAYSGRRQLAFFENSLVSTDVVMQELSKRNLPFERGRLATDCIYCGLTDVSHDPLYTDGAICVQSEASMLVCDVADPQKGMRVLDACAAPGGKSVRMAAKMGWGTIHAWDVHPHRVELIHKNAARCHAGFVTPMLQNAEEYLPELSEMFDLVLVDAPCSGLGVVGSKPDIKYSKSFEMINQLSQLQRSILACCARYVRKGGALVYSTCTIMREENEENVAWLLEQFPEYRLDRIRIKLPNGTIGQRNSSGTLQLYPHIDGVDGFFVARLVRQ